MLQYNVQGGKMNRGLAVPLTFKMLVPVERHTEELMHKAYIVGWCVELVSGAARRRRRTHSGGWRTVGGCWTDGVFDR